MSDSTINQSPQYPPEFAGHGMSLEPGEGANAYLLTGELNYDAQIHAIKNLLMRHRDDALASRNEIRKIDADARRLTGWQNERAVEDWLASIDDAIYQDAAHSMAAVGMLAPLVESLFHQALSNIRKYDPTSSLVQNHQRWQQAGDDQWDCHYVWNKGKRSKNLIKGILQLADAVGLAPHLPNDLQLYLEALFEYRNKMFHHGFEWPIDHRRKFKDRINNWPNEWFFVSTSGGEPMIFYMTHSFINKWLDMIDQILKSFDAFIRKIHK